MHTTQQLDAAHHFIYKIEYFTMTLSELALLPVKFCKKYESAAQLP